MNDVTKAALELTQQWAVEELDAARSRATFMRVGGTAYNEAIGAVDNLIWLLDRLENTLNGTPIRITEVTDPPRPEEPEHPAETEAAAVFEEPEPEKPPRTVDLAEIRTKAKAARDAGVKLTDVWAAFGGSKLSDVPHTKYGELLDMLEEKMQEAGA